MKLNGSQIVLEVLKEQGVDTILAIPAERFSIFSMNYINTVTHSIIF